MDDLAPRKDSRFAPLFIRTMPREMKAHFRAWCLKHDVSMRDMIVELMRDVVSGDIGKERLNAIQRRLNRARNRMAK